MLKYALSFLVGVTLLSGSILHAADSLVFSAARDYTQNFRPMPDVTLLRFEDGGLWAKKSKTWYGGAIYEPRGREKAMEEGRVETELAYEGEQSVRTYSYLLARYDEDSCTGLIGGVIIPNPERIRLLIRFNIDPFIVYENNDSAPPIETLIDWEFDVKEGGEGYYREALNRGRASGKARQPLQPGDRLTLRLEQKEKPQRAFCLTVLNEAGQVIATTGFQSNPKLSAVAQKGGVGIGAFVAPGDAVQFFSFSAEFKK